MKDPEETWVWRAVMACAVALLAVFLLVALGGCATPPPCYDTAEQYYACRAAAMTETPR